MAAGKLRITYPMGGFGLYNIGGVIFDNGVAEVDELSHAQREALDLIGATIEDGEQTDEEPAEGSPEAEETPGEPGSPEETPETPTAPEGAIEPETPEQAAAQPHEIQTVSSDSDGNAVLDAGSGRHAGDSVDEEQIGA